MAAPSPWQWPSNKTTISLHSSNLPHFYNSKRHRIIASSSNFYSFSSSACCAATGSARKRLKKSVEPIKINDDLQNKEPYSSSINGAFSGLQKGPSLSFKSLFARRALWRRIFFASKKVRSILLLNVITIIYGKPLNFHHRFFVFCFMFAS